MKNSSIAALFLALAALASFQFFTIGSLKRDLNNLRAQLHVAPPEPDSNSKPSPQTPSLSLGSLPARVTTLEKTVGELSRTADFLAERGMVPPSPTRVEEIQGRFFDVAAADADRLRAFRLMRRNGAITDEVALQAVNWLQSSTNSNTRRELLRQMDGLTNAAIKDPLLAMVATESNGGVREELVDILGDFSHDPAVEAKMWDLAINDPNGEVREEAADALTEGSMTPERIASLQKKAADPSLPLDVRLLALQGLREADSSAPELINEMVTLAQNSTDPVTRAKLFDAFDGINDPALMPSLVNGLQDPNPVVRERAADALSSFSSDPRIQEWLNHVIQNDTDPRVKREAHQALEQSQRRRGGR